MKGMRLIRGGALALVLLLGLLPSWAANDTDHPLIGGMPAFNIRSKTETPFDAVDLEASEVAQAKGSKYDGPLHFEGRVTRLVYSTKIGARSSVVEVYRNYLAAVQSAGGRSLNTPAKGDYVHKKHVFQLPRSGLPPAVVLLNIPYDTEYYLTIVEPAAMVQSVKAEDLARELAADGWATLYINFDTNRAELKDDGLAAVKEIARLLNQQPQLRLSIEGHTDNVGEASANRRLSEARAEAVLAAVKAQGIEARRLVAKGQGADIPIADNRKEEGRAKNRRVELGKLP